jgi:hypothetical protein
MVPRMNWRYALYALLVISSLVVASGAGWNWG